MKPYSKMNSKNTALVIIDIVNGCCHENCEDLERGITFSKIRKMVPQLNSFVEKFREKVGGKIIFTNITPWTKEHLPENIKELYEDPVATYYSDGSKFEEDFYIVKPRKEDIIITKNNYDTFSNPEFDKILRENGIQYLIMTGVFTDGCVLATICGGFSHGYNFVVLKDLIETTDVKIRQELCKHLLDFTFPIMYGKTITSSELLNTW
ncbi:MAG: cysteine hydrolase [Candidatus Taylorbacteria bacterium]|nr:cysteine hydrolase [Candidatus Taylorbacteria bacterium]